MPKTQKIKEFGKKIIDSLYWDLYYTVGYSCTAGLGNGLADIKEEGSFPKDFGEGFINNFQLGIVINLAYPIVFNQLKKSKNYRLYANLFVMGISAGFLAWHYFAGTENPLETMALNTAVGLGMANKHVSETKNIEKKVE